MNEVQKDKETWKKILKRHSLTINDAAGLCRVSRSYLSSVINGRSKPSTRLLNDFLCNCTQLDEKEKTALLRIKSNNNDLDNTKELKRLIVKLNIAMKQKNINEFSYLVDEFNKEFDKLKNVIRNY